MIINFSKEYKFEGKSYNSVELKVEDLSGNDLMSLQSEWLRKAASKHDPYNKNVLTINLDTNFLLYACARTSNLPIEFFTGLPLKDFLKVTGEMQAFLLSSE